MTTTLPLIGFAGRKRSGKNAAADALARAHGYEIAAFADPLRDLVAAIDPVVAFDAAAPASEPVLRYTDALSDLGYEVAKDAFPEVRRIVQVVGTEGVRETLGTKYGLRDILGDDLWVVLAERRVRAALSRRVHDRETDRLAYHWNRPLAFADVRFPNEADMIRRHGGIIIRIERPSLGPATDLHVSETALDDYTVDHAVTNDGTMSDLETAVLALTQ